MTNYKICHIDIVNNTKKQLLLVKINNSFYS